MYNLFILSVLLLLLTPSYTINEPFIGRIDYKNSFTDLRGTDISSRLSPILGSENAYFINDRNYKASDENKNLLYLYKGETNTYYSINKNKRAQKIDASKTDNGKYVVTKLQRQEKVAGYLCNSIRVEKDTISIVYFYSPLIRVNSSNFAQHNFGQWNKYLAATNGALPLKFILTDQKIGFIWTSVAAQISKEKLTALDFELSRDIKVSN